MLATSYFCFQVSISISQGLNARLQSSEFQDWPSFATFFEPGNSKWHLPSVWHWRNRMVFSSAPQPTPPYEDAASTTDRPRLIDERTARESRYYSHISFTFSASSDWRSMYASVRKLYASTDQRPFFKVLNRKVMKFDDG